MSKPSFVAISDIHFNVNNLEIASKALIHALDKAKELEIPIVIAGDLQDTKAIIRAEVANRLLEILSRYNNQSIYIIVGNHDLINEKGDDNAINYIYRSNVYIVDQPVNLGFAYLIPYQNTVERFKNIIRTRDPKQVIVCHQGVQGAFMGDYIQDKTSIDSSELVGYKIISGHYHKHQTVGSLTYIGSPFTHTFGEANDGPKGYLIVNEDGTYERETLNFRKHVKIEAVIFENSGIIFPQCIRDINKDDLLWLRVTGPQSELDTINKDYFGKFLIGHSNYKLDLIPLESESVNKEEVKNMSPSEVLDALIDATKENDTQKTRLKDLYRSLL